MSLFKKAEELTIPTTLRVLIYGQYGLGKTTLALSAPKPVLFDFDDSIRRVNIRHQQQAEYVEVKLDFTDPQSAWNNIRAILSSPTAPADFAPFETIVVDTIGKMMDAIILYCVGNRNPQINDWGKINAQFKWFVRTVTNMNKHVVFVAQAESREVKGQDGTMQYFFPSIRQKNYAAIASDFDLIGYCEMNDIRGRMLRTITFNATNRNDGKNTCLLPPLMTIPQLLDAQGNVVEDNTFLTTQVIMPYIAMANEKIERNRKYAEVMQSLRDEIREVTDANSVNGFIENVIKGKDYPHVGSSQAMSRQMLSARLRELPNVEYDKELKKYVDKTEL